jgi:tight adherence protein B
MIMEKLYFIVQFIIILVIIIVFSYVLKILNSISKEKRISSFSIIALSDKPISFIEKLHNLYYSVIKSISKTISKSKVCNDYSKKYEKFVVVDDIYKQTSMDFISKKILFAILAVLLSIISNILKFKMFSFFQILISFLFGFFILDVFLKIREKKEAKRIEQDFLKAVIIMNNAFKSGRSIMQAVELVSTELDGPISNEFKKILIDLTYGLELEVVFDRFASRVKLEEVKYMASSLVILNETGGKITKIFSSIERSFIERKRIKDEMNSTLALSNFVFKVLVAIPFIIFVLIYFMDPTYFVPLIKEPLGNLILVLIILIYIIYIILVKKIVKIREW